MFEWRSNCCRRREDENSIERCSMVRIQAADWPGNPGNASYCMLLQQMWRWNSLRQRCSKSSDDCDCMFFWGGRSDFPSTRPLTGWWVHPQKSWPGRSQLHLTSCRMAGEMYLSPGMIKWKYLKIGETVKLISLIILIS
jgi:hypothetical protein